MQFDPSRYPYLTAEDRALSADLALDRERKRLCDSLKSTLYLAKQAERFLRLRMDLLAEAADDELATHIAAYLLAEILCRGTHAAIVDYV
jgi:hypothetical protein